MTKARTDCLFYGKMDDDGCKALNEMVCLKRKCPFFKPTKATPKFEANMEINENEMWNEIWDKVGSNP